MQSSNPYLPPSNPEPNTQTLVPLRWRVGRICAFCLLIGGILFAIAGYVAGLPASSAASGEVFGGCTMILSGVIVLCLLLSMKRKPIQRRKLWFIFALIALCVGGLFFVDGLSIVNRERAKLDAARKNLESISNALEEYKASGKK